MRHDLAQCDDTELVSLVADQHRDALAELYRRHAPWLDQFTATDFGGRRAACGVIVAD